jgi:hypothetical protein
MILPEPVILRSTGDEAVVLNLASGLYYAINPLGLRMLQVLNQVISIVTDLAILLAEYAVDPLVLRSDMQTLLDTLLEQGLVELV